MSKYQIITDATCDLSADILQAYPIHVIDMLYTLDGEGFSYNPVDTQSIPTFYQALSQGKVAQSSQISSFVYEEVFKEYLDQEIDVLYLGFSSQLSGTYECASNVIKSLADQYPERTIRAVDTLAASAGQGLIVYRALELQKKGVPLNETAAQLESSVIQNTMLWFTVNDLKHLNRTGRLSNGAAWLGYVLKIKPVLHCDKNGKLVPVFKCTGRKAALKKLVTLVEEVSAEQQKKNDVIFISHSNCLEDARWVESSILEILPECKIYISDIGPVVGTHTGTGTVALFFTGDHR